MDPLLPIGRFSRRTGLTVRALRLYDRTGLLRPALVDLHSGYRYYAPEQIITAERIVLLRAVEMPLADIAAILQGDPGTIRQRIDLHRQRLEQRVEAYRAALALLQTLEPWWEPTRKERSVDDKQKDYRCSFCGKPHEEVHRLIAGPHRVYICDACVGLCNEILAKEKVS